MLEEHEIAFSEQFRTSSTETLNFIQSLDAKVLLIFDNIRRDLLKLIMNILGWITLLICVEQEHGVMH